MVFKKKICLANKLKVYFLVTVSYTLYSSFSSSDLTNYSMKGLHKGMSDGTIILSNNNKEKMFLKIILKSKITTSMLLFIYLFLNQKIIFI